MTEPKEQPRTDSQRKAIEVYCREVAKALYDEGHTLQDVIKEVKKAEITPTQSNIKAVVWNGINEALFKKTSSTELSTTEVTKIYEVMNKWLGEKFEIHIPFPNEINDDPQNKK